jgi:hypothetical protein
MLKDVEYPDWDKQTLDSLTVEKFKRYFEGLKEKNKALYEMHKNRLERDIIEILEGKEIIKKLLKGGKDIFPEERVEDYKPFIVDKYKSRAVKEVIIYSPRLEGLENVIIYDLPGFDSPTFIHSAFTIEKLKKADGVVFIREADKPSLKGPEVNIISQTREADGVPLKEKMFYFLTKVDILNTPEEVQEVKQKFIEELKRYDLFISESRIFLGSALAHLVKLGQKENSDVLKKLQKLGVTDGIEELKQALVEYNRTERAKILQKRVNNLLREVYEFIETTISELEKAKENLDFISLAYEELIETLFSVRETIKREVEKYHKELKEKLLKERLISQKLREKIAEKILPPSEEDIENTKWEVEAKSPSLEERPMDFNHKLREKLRSIYRENFNQLVKETILDQKREFEDSITRIVVEAFQPSPEVEPEIRKRVREFLEENLSRFSYDTQGLKSLVERFSGDIIDLLSIPLTVSDREVKFNEVQREIYSLMAYDEYFDPYKPIFNHPYIWDILTHKRIPYEKIEELKEILGILISVFLKLKGDSVNIPYGIIISLGFEFLKREVNAEKLKKFLIQKLLNENFSLEELISDLQNLVSGKIEDVEVFGQKDKLKKVNDMIVEEFLENFYEGDIQDLIRYLKRNRKYYETLQSLIRNLNRVPSPEDLFELFYERFFEENSLAPDDNLYRKFLKLTLKGNISLDSTQKDIFIESIKWNITPFEIRRYLKDPSTYEEVVEEIAYDVELLKTIMKNSIVNAINVEKSFVVAATNYINALKELTEKQTFNKFVASIVRILKAEQFNQLENLQKYKIILDKIIEQFKKLSINL